MAISGKLEWKQFPWEHANVQDIYKHTVTLVGGFVYVYGGRAVQNPAFYVYSLRDRTWSRVPVERTRRLHCTVLAEDKLYLIGGILTNTTASVPKPIEAFDLTLQSSEVVWERFRSHRHCAVYVESRREIFITRGPLIRLNAFSIATRNLSKVEVKGVRATLTRGHSVVEYAGQLFILTSFGPNFSALYVVKLGHGNVAYCSQVKCGPLPGRRRVQLQVVKGYFMGFGGTTTQGKSDHVFLFEPRTRKWKEADREDTVYIKHEGPWPGPGVMRSVTFDGKLLLFGGKHIPSIVEAEFFPN